MKLLLCGTLNEAQRWDDYVNSHPSGTYCHLWGWKQVIENSFRWQTHYLAAEENGRIHGVLPLVVQKSWLFGCFVSSMPFLNAGGVLADSHEVELLLLEEAVRITRNVKARHLELRHQMDHKLDIPVRTNKVTVVLPLDPDPDKMWKALNTKIRTK